jgi:uncharacterized repeat protein (TIGR03803 family)
MNSWSHNASIQVGSVIYGTSTEPPAGCVFKAEKDGGGYAVLHKFGGRRGYDPDGVIAVGGVLYGVTRCGGPGYRPSTGFAGYGVLYRLTLDGSAFEVLHNFTRTEGPSPRGVLAYVVGLLYGATSETLFRIRPDGTGFATVHRFRAPGADGPTPTGGLMVSNDVLYGVAFSGSDDHVGSVFRYEPLSGRFRMLGDVQERDASQPLETLPGAVQMTYGTTNRRRSRGVLSYLEGF